MTTRTVAITGATGYLGKHLAKTYREQGYLTLALSRALPDPSFGYSSHKRFELGAEIAPEALSGIDTLIHCAHDFSGLRIAESLKINLVGSLKLFKAANDAAVRRIIFISSMAAFSGCKSVYGQTKLAIENDGAKLGVLSLRPGTIWGGETGGLFRSLEKIALGLPIVPLISGQSLRLYLVHVHELCAAICRLATEMGLKEPISLANGSPVSLAEIIRELATSRGRKPLYFPVPASLIYFGLKSLELVGLTPPFRSDSLLSLSNPNPNPDFSAASALGFNFRPFP